MDMIIERQGKMGINKITVILDKEEEQFEKVLNRIIGGMFQLKDELDDEHAMEVMEEVADLIEKRLEE